MKNVSAHGSQRKAVSSRSTRHLTLNVYSSCCAARDSLRLAWALYEHGFVVMGIIVGLFLGLTLILLGETKPKYTVELTQASKPVTVLTSYDGEYTAQVAAALTQAYQGHA